METMTAMESSSFVGVQAGRYDPVEDAKQQMARIADGLTSRRAWLDSEIDRLMVERSKVEAVMMQLTGEVRVGGGQTAARPKARRFQPPTTIDALNLTQQQIITLLTERGPLTAPEINAALDVQTFGNYAGPMTRAGLIARKRVTVPGKHSAPHYVYAISAEQLASVA